MNYRESTIKQLIHKLRAAGRNEEARTLEHISIPQCTGISAAWCPICGDCCCHNEDGNRYDLDNPQCPLHKSSSRHGEKTIVDPGEALEVALDWAEERFFISEKIQRSIGKLLPSTKILSAWMFIESRNHIRINPTTGGIIVHIKQINIDTFQIDGKTFSHTKSFTSVDHAKSFTDQILESIGYVLL